MTTPRRAAMTCMKIAIRLASADHPEQAVLELRAALQVGAPVARVHVADADEDGRADEGPPLPPEAGFVVRHRDGAVDVFEREITGGRDGGSGLVGAGISAWGVSSSISRGVNYS